MANEPSVPADGQRPAMMIASLEPESDAPAIRPRWRLFVVLVTLAAIASLASVPAEIASLSNAQADILWWAPFIAFALGFIPTVAAIAIGVGTFPRTALDIPIIRRLVDRQPGTVQMTRAILVRSIFYGTVCFVVVHPFTEWVEPILVPELAKIASEHAADPHALTPLQLTLLSFAAGVREEFIFRFGLLTLFVWVGIRFFRLPKRQSLLFWTANVLAVVPFALMHILNAVGLEIPITSGLIVAVLLANGGVGLMCGWLYSRYGIESAMIAHTGYDLIQFIVWPFLVQSTA